MSELITVRALNNQTLIDLALIHYGATGGVEWLIEDNPTISVTDRIAPGQVINIRLDVIDKSVKTYYQEKGVQPSTGNVEQPDFNEDFNEDFL